METTAAESMRQASPEERLRRLALVDIPTDKYPLSQNQKAVFSYLARAADYIDAIFWKQSCPDAEALRKKFATELSTDKRLRKYFEINYGPYDRLADNKPFLPVSPKPPGAGFYPPDLTKEELLNYVNRHGKENEALISPYTIVRRDRAKLYAVPYHEAYSENIQQAAEALLKAATHETRDPFRGYLEARARALKDDDYYESDLQWIDLPPDGLDIVIGPCEVYEDGLMGLRAAYEAMITFQDPVEAEEIQHFVKELKQFHNYLVRRLGLQFDPPGSTTPLVVADLLYSTGDARKGIPAIAFTLPNDEKVIQQKGTKEVILRNVLRAKFQHVLLPICEAICNESFDEKLAFEGYLHHTILHEISHALGPRRIKVNGENTTVNRSLRELHTTFEEAKADVLGACWLLRTNSTKSGGNLSSILAAYLPGVIRAIRFGQAAAHGRSNLLQFNYLAAHGAIQVAKDGSPLLSPLPLEEGLMSLAKEILKIQSQGDRQAAERMSQTYCKHTPITRILLQKLDHLPTDIAISFSGLAKV